MDQSVQRVGYGLDDRGSRVRFPEWVGNFSLHHRVENGSRTHPASYSMGTRGSFPGGKAAGVWNWPPPSNAEVKRMSGAIPPLPRPAFMVWRSVKKMLKDNFTFTFITRPTSLFNETNTLLQHTHVTISYFVDCTNNCRRSWLSDTLLLKLNDQSNTD
jgi:hypothetical protein